MVVKEDRMLRLIGDMYDAAASPDLWPATLIELSSIVGGCGALLFSTTRPKQELAWGAPGGLDPDLLDDYDRYYAPLDFRGFPTLQMPVGALYANETLCTRHALVRSQIYHEFLTKYDIVHILGTILNRTDRQQTQISIQRREKDGPFPTEQCQVIQLLAPHLRRAIDLQDRLGGLTARNAGLREILDRLPVGTCLFNDQGSVVGTNRQAERILERGDGLQLIGRILTCKSTHAAQELSRLVRSATAATRLLVSDPGGVVRVPRSAPSGEYSVLVLPLGERSTACAERVPTAVAFIFDPEDSTKPAPAVLHILYGFTNAESRMAELLMSGVTVAQAAEQLNISLNTARTHLKRIFSKTGVSRQSALVRELLTGPARFLSQAQPRRESEDE